jgi:hypothetical protein
MLRRLVFTVFLTLIWNDLSLGDGKKVPDGLNLTVEVIEFDEDSHRFQVVNEGKGVIYPTDLNSQMFNLVYLHAGGEVASGEERSDFVDLPLKGGFFNKKYLRGLVWLFSSPNLSLSDKMSKVERGQVTYVVLRITRSPLTIMSEFKIFVGVKRTRPNVVEEIDLLELAFPVDDSVDLESLFCSSAIVQRPKASFYLYRTNPEPGILKLFREW